MAQLLATADAFRLVRELFCITRPGESVVPRVRARVLALLPDPTTSVAWPEIFSVSPSDV